MPQADATPRVGEMLRTAREEASVGLREHARGMGISHTRLGRLEGQGADLRLGTIASYAAALGCELTLTLTLPDGRVVDLLASEEA